MDLSSSESDYSSDVSESDFSDSEESNENLSDEELSQMSSQMSLFDEDITSDDDNCNPPCHWSIEQPTYDPVALDPLLTEGNVFGKPSQRFPEDTTPAGIVLSIVDDTFIATCVNATYEYGLTDPEFVKHLGDIFTDFEKAKAFLIGFFTIQWHLGLIGLPHYRWAWKSDELRHQHAISKIMTLRQHQLMLRYFRCVPRDGLPANGTADYHPLQNIMAGVNMLQANSSRLWEVGRMLCIDEGDYLFNLFNLFKK